MKQKLTQTFFIFVSDNVSHEYIDCCFENKYFLLSSFFYIWLTFYLSYMIEVNEKLRHMHNLKL